VSDFGLTTFKSNIKRGGAAGVATVHWSAPEVLNECHDVDYILADVYSFGIIMWEILTREQPYSGMRYADYRAPLSSRCQLSGRCAHSHNFFAGPSKSCGSGGGGHSKQYASNAAVVD
jgi:serine/threonine protein kinase